MLMSALIPTSGVLNTSSLYEWLVVSNPHMFSHRKSSNCLSPRLQEFSEDFVCQSIELSTEEEWERGRSVNVSSNSGKRNIFPRIIGIWYCVCVSCCCNWEGRRTMSVVGFLTVQV